MGYALKICHQEIEFYGLLLTRPPCQIVAIGKKIFIIGKGLSTWTYQSKPLLNFLSHLNNLEALYFFVEEAVAMQSYGLCAKSMSSRNIGLKIHLEELRKLV